MAATEAKDSSGSTRGAAAAFDASMSRWRLGVSNADVRSVFEFVTIVGFRAPTRDEAQRVWLQLTEQQCGLKMPIASLIPDQGMISQPVARRPVTALDPHSNRELARVWIGETEMSLDEFLTNQCVVNNGALAASPLIFNAATYLYRHVNSYTPNEAKFPHSLKEEFALFTAFVTDAGNESLPLQIYNMKNLRSPLAQIVFVCPGCRRHCTTFALPAVCRDEKNARVQWCGAVVCNIAGPLSEAVMTAMAPQQTYQLTQGQAAALASSQPRPVYLMRQRGCGEVVTQLTRELRIDASLEVWRVVMSGELARASALSGVWLPSATAWRFQAGFVPDYALEFSWPPNRPVLEWRQSLHSGASGCDNARESAAADVAYRCQLLNKRVYESEALAAIEQALPEALTDARVADETRRVFPQLRTAGAVIGPRPMLARLILYFQINRTRMREADSDAFGAYFLSLGVSELAAAAVATAASPVALHQRSGPDTGRKACACTTVASFLSTYSNRIELNAVTAVAAKDLRADADTDDDGGGAGDAWQVRQQRRLRKPTEQWRRQIAAFDLKDPNRRPRTRIEDLKGHIANLNVSMTPDDAMNIQIQTQGARMAAMVIKTPLLYKPIELVSRKRRCALPVEELLSLARWNGSASDDDARMLMAAGVAAYFVAILACRGPYADLVKLRNMARPGRVIHWHPTRDAILQHLPKRPGDTPNPKPSTCTLLCVYLETRWPSVFESSSSSSSSSTVDTASATALATQLLQSGLCSITEPPRVVSWCRAPPVAEMETLPDCDGDDGAEVLVDIKCMPTGLPPDDVELCLELLEAGRRLLETNASAAHQTSIAFEPTRKYAALEPFHRNGLEPRNVAEACAMLRSSSEQCNTAALPAYVDGSSGVDLNDPAAFLTPSTGRFWFDSVATQAFGADFRFPSQRVRQYEFVQHYMRLMTTGGGGGGGSEIGVDDVTVMLNMTARLDRMWRRDFPALKIVGNQDKEQLRAKQLKDWGGSGVDGLRAMGDMRALLKLGKLVASHPEDAMLALDLLRTAGAAPASNYMNIEFMWPRLMTPELRQLRHQLGVFRYNRATLPYAMERLVVDIVLVEACCVRVLDTLGKATVAAAAIEDEQRAWVNVCFAMFTVFDLRPIFMSSMPPAPAVTRRV